MPPVRQRCASPCIRMRVTDSPPCPVLSAVGVVIAGVLVVVGISWTLQAMVGLNDSFIYEPTSIVTNRPI